MRSKYVRIDCDNVGDKIELCLYKHNTQEAQQLNDTIRINIANLADAIVEKLKGEILVTGADDILFKTAIENYDLNELNNLRNQFFDKTNITISAGVGNNITEALKNLKIAKISGKNQIVEEH